MGRRTPYASHTPHRASHVSIEPPRSPRFARDVGQRLERTEVALRPKPTHLLRDALTHPAALGSESPPATAASSYRRRRATARLPELWHCQESESISRHRAHLVCVWHVAWHAWYARGMCMVLCRVAERMQGMHGKWQVRPTSSGTAAISRQ